MEHRYQAGNRTASVRFEREENGWRVSIDGGPMRLVRMTQPECGSLEFNIDGQQSRIHFAAAGDKRFVAIGSDSYELTKVERTSTRANRHDIGAASGSLEAAMPGQVVAVAVHAGDEVTRGQTLVVLEAMKMELRITAPRDGKVRHIHVASGQVVERGQVLAELE